MGTKARRVKVSSVTGRVSNSFAEHISCFSNLSKDLERIFSLVDVDLFVAKGSATEQFLAIVNPELEASGWKPEFLLNTTIPEGVPEGNYLMDFHKVFSSDNCAAMHLATIELCFDNRQAIAGNIGKANLANSSFSTDQNHVAASYLVTVSPEVRKSGKWDTSVGRTAEYEYAIEVGYHSMVSSPIFIVSLI